MEMSIVHFFICLLISAMAARRDNASVDKTMLPGCPWAAPLALLDEVWGVGGVLDLFRLPLPLPRPLLGDGDGPLL